MKKIFSWLFLAYTITSFAQEVQFQTLLKDDISIRALQIHKGKVWYAGSGSKFGYVSLKDSADRKQILLSQQSLEFRTLARDKDDFYTINVGSPAYVYKVNQHKMKPELVFTDPKRTAFYDAFFINRRGTGLAISDPDEQGLANGLTIADGHLLPIVASLFPKYQPGEAHFAASNSNIVMRGKNTWIATGGMKARIFKHEGKKNTPWKVIETPFVQGESTRGIYSIDFHNHRFGIAVGGDYTRQKDNINNIATTKDGGRTWQIQASGKNAGYKTCVKFRPGSRGREILAVADGQIEFSRDYGKSWTVISEEKGLYICDWLNRNTVILAGKNRIVRMEIKK